MKLAYEIDINKFIVARFSILKTFYFQKIKTEVIVSIFQLD